MEKINWGILGLGDIAQKFSDGFRETTNSKLLAVSSKNPEKLKKFESKFNIEKRYLFNEYENLLNCKDIDVIYIALPNSLHHHWVIKSIQNKKHILVEKPATLNFMEIKDIEKNLINKNLFFGEAFMYRHLPQINLVINMIKNGEIGNLLSMKSFFGTNLLLKKKLFFFNKKKKINPNNRLFNKKLGGGCILDLGCYPMSFSILINSLKSKINENDLKVFNVKKEIGETNVDIDSYANLSFDNKFISEIGASFKKELGTMSEIRGDKGIIRINNTWLGDNNVLKIKDNNHDLINIKNHKNIYSYQIQNISQTISAGAFQPQYPSMTLRETLLNMKAIDEWLNV